MDIDILKILDQERRMYDKRLNELREAHEQERKFETEKYEKMIEKLSSEHSKIIELQEHRDREFRLKIDSL